MSSSRNLIVSASAALAAVILLAGCAASPDDSGQGGGSPAPAGELEFDAAWLDEGRMVAVVTQGSSTCIPIATEITAEGQTVSVTLDDGDNKVCTADLAPRASLVALPEGVDPTKDIELIVTLGGVAGSEDLDGDSALTGTPGEPTDYRPSAGWFDDGALVLLTWGSSTCPPIVEAIDTDGSNGTVTFASEDRVCTTDMAPRATIIGFQDLGDGAEDGFVLALVGDNLDATVNVAKG